MPTGLFFYNTSAPFQLLFSASSPLCCSYATLCSSPYYIICVLNYNNHISSLMLLDLLSCYADEVFLHHYLPDWCFLIFSGSIMSSKINKTCLLCEEFNSELQNLNSSSFSNGKVIDIYRHCQLRHKSSWHADILKFICIVFPDLKSLQPANIVRKIAKVDRLSKKLSKDKLKDARVKLLSAPFSPDNVPTITDYVPCKENVKVVGLPLSLRGRKRKADSLSELGPESLTRAAKEIAVELSEEKSQRLDMEQKYAQLHNQTSQLKSNIKRFKPRVINQKMKRHKIAMKKVQSRLLNLKKSEKSTKHKLNKYMKKTAPKRKCVSVQTETKNKMNTCLPKCQSVQCNFENYEVKKLNEKITYLENQLSMSREELCSQKDSFTNIIQTRTSEKGKPFNAAVRQTYYEFLGSGVNVEKIEPLIRSTISNLTGREIDSLPSSSTAADMITELGSISRLHLADVLSTEKNLTIHRDGTSKLGKHYSGVQIATKTDVFTVGLDRISTGTADNYFKTNLDMLKDIGSSSAPDNSDRK